jgi:hypothetical protein
MFPPLFAATIIAIVEAPLQENGFAGEASFATLFRYSTLLKD